MADVGRAAALVVDDRDLVALGAEPQHRAQEVLRGRAEEPRRAHDPRAARRPRPRRAASCARMRRAATARPTRRTARASPRRRRSRVEQTTSGAPSSAACCDAADVDRGRALRVVLGAVDVRPRGRVQDEVAPRARRRRERDVPVGARRAPRASGKRLEQRVPELPARAGDQDAAAWSRSERIGDRVLQRSTTRGSSHGDAVLVGVGRVVLLGHEVTEEAVGERLVAVRVRAGDVERDGVVLADVLGERLAASRGRARRRAPSPRGRGTGRPGRARGSGGRGSRPCASARGSPGATGFGSALARISSMNQPRSSS